jgi:cell division GTPase FtsZ
VLAMLPDNIESNSSLVAQNASTVANALSELAEQGQLSPLLLIDNQRVGEIYKGKFSLDNYFQGINTQVAQMFDAFNTMSKAPSDFITFDEQDFGSVMRSAGHMLIGASALKDFTSSTAIAEALRNNVQKTSFATGFDLTTAKVAGVVAIVGEKAMATQGLMDSLNFAFNSMQEMMGRATLHRGVYRGKGDTVRVFTIIGGMTRPLERYKRLGKFVG